MQLDFFELGTVLERRITYGFYGVRYIYLLKIGAVMECQLTYFGYGTWYHHLVEISFSVICHILYLSGTLSYFQYTVCNDIFTALRPHRDT